MTTTAPREQTLTTALATAIDTLEECRSFIRDETKAPGTVRHLTGTIHELRSQLAELGHSDPVEGQNPNQDDAAAVRRVKEYAQYRATHSPVAREVLALLDPKHPDAETDTTQEH